MCLFFISSPEVVFTCFQMFDFFFFFFLGGGEYSLNNRVYGDVGYFFFLEEEL